MFEKAAKADPKNPVIFKNIGVLYLSSGQPAIARKYFEEGLKVNPRSHDLKNCLKNLDKILNDSNIVLQADYKIK